MTIFKGDNTGAFGNNFIKISLNNPHGFEIKKAEFKCGCITRMWENPIFPLYVNFTEDESKQLSFKNVCYLAVWDNLGRKKTCKGYLVFKANDEVV